MNKEQVAESMKQTLKNGLFNGLKISVGEPWQWSNGTMHELHPEIFLDCFRICVQGYANPNLFPLSYLNQEITVEGFNNNHPFVPIEWIETNCSLGHSGLLEEVLKDDRWINQLPKYIHDYLVKMKFNTEGLPPESFIDASKSKVYEPKSK